MKRFGNCLLIMWRSRWRASRRGRLTHISTLLRHPYRSSGWMLLALLGLLTVTARATSSTWRTICASRFDPAKVGPTATGPGA